MVQHNESCICGEEYPGTYTILGKLIVRLISLSLSIWRNFTSYIYKALCKYSMIGRLSSLSIKTTLFSLIEPPSHITRIIWHMHFFWSNLYKRCRPLVSKFSWMCRLSVQSVHTPTLGFTQHHVTVYKACGIFINESYKKLQLPNFILYFNISIFCKPWFTTYNNKSFAHVKNSQTRYSKSPFSPSRSVI